MKKYYYSRGRSSIELLPLCQVADKEIRKDAGYLFSSYCGTIRDGSLEFLESDIPKKYKTEYQQMLESIRGDILEDFGHYSPHPGLSLFWRGNLLAFCAWSMDGLMFCFSAKQVKELYSVQMHVYSTTALSWSRKPGKKLIPVKDENYVPLFYMKDGGMISYKIFTGEVCRGTLKYLDETHFELIDEGRSSGCCWHVDQFGERHANLLEIVPV